jgi:arylsulfatase
MKRIVMFSLFIVGLIAGDPVLAQPAKPNILVIFGDDIGITNVSAYSDGLMGYETPNIDRIAKEGVRFLHYYGERTSWIRRSADC